MLPLRLFYFRGHVHRSRELVGRLGFPFLDADLTLIDILSEGCKGKALGIPYVNGTSSYL